MPLLHVQTKYVWTLYWNIGPLGGYHKITILNQLWEGHIKQTDRHVFYRQLCGFSFTSEKTKNCSQLKMFFEIQRRPLESRRIGPQKTCEKQVRLRRNLTR